MRTPVFLILLARTVPPAAVATAPASQWWRDVARNGSSSLVAAHSSSSSRQLLFYDGNSNGGGGGGGGGSFGAHVLHDRSLPAVRVEWSRSPDSVGFNKVRDPKHDKAATCIHPSPFGIQCTTHRAHALGSCLALGCKALVCPDQRPYERGQPKKRIAGAICQVRSHADLNEPRHGMCKPGGCTRWVVSRGTLGDFIDTAALQMMPLQPQSAAGAVAPLSGRSATLAVILPGNLLQYECRTAPDRTNDPRFCGCLDVSQLGSVLQQRPLPSERAVLCVIGR